MFTPTLSPQDFIATWRDNTLKERSAAQSHFNDLCRLLGEPTPTEADPHGEWFCFEKGVKKTGGGDGWADVWRKGCFAWECSRLGRGALRRNPAPCNVLAGISLRFIPAYRFCC